ncbi:RHS repeat domain-containing protein [Ekhidna sp.]|uniref:RHS repeat domain-containing protein n=1 Tax=Ekhidna sp. TaxID=2608089 RepID=UPI003298EFA2
MKRLLLICHLTIVSLLVFAQETIRPEISVIPPSPNAAAINKFVDVPVSFYTGTPNITIPLFTLQVEGISLPISLDYHASGLKVEEKASNVGAGWRLNAGGVITRSIHGLPDEVYNAGTFNSGEQRGLFQTSFIVSPNNSNDSLYTNGGALDWTYINSCDVYYPVLSDGTTSRPVDPLDHLAGGNWDLEPDMYHLSYPGGSSKFIFERDGSLFELMEDDIVFNKYPFTSNASKRCVGCPAITANSDPTNTDYSFGINDQNGISYTYGDVERTTAVSGCFPNDPDDNNGVSNRQSAWYLSTMSIGSRAISFNYDTETILHENNYYETQQFKVPGTTGTVEAKGSTCMNDMTVIAKRISSITTTNGYEVIFVADTSDRDDLEGSHQIKEIIVKLNGEVIKHYRLIQSYFGSNDKLRLDEVQIVNPEEDTEVLNKYTLDYFSGSFPAIDSKSQDYWGYYNGSGNSSMIPEWKDANYHVNSSTSADREPNILFAKVGTLSKITYPTSGYTLFDYELNDFYNENYAFTYNYVSSASGGTEGNPVEDYEYFTVGSACTATLTYTLPQGGLDGGAQLQKHNGTTYMPHTPSATIGNRVNLDAGDYRLYTASESSNEFIAEIEFEQVDTEKFVTAGGLRIKKMTFHDPVTNKNEYRFYEYTSGSGLAKTSSGKLYTDPRIGGYITSATTGNVGQTCIEDNGSITSFVNLSQVSQIPLGVSQGSPVGYDRVVTYKMDSGIKPVNGFADSVKVNGETIYTYKNDTHTSQLVYPPVPLEDLDYKNGKLKIKEDYRLNASNALEQIMEEVNTYEDAHDTEAITSPSVTAYMFRKAANRTCYSCIPANTIYASYKIYRRWNRLLTKVEKSIENKELSKSTTFTYDAYQSGWSHHQTESMETTNSLGETVEFTFTRISTVPGLISMLTEERDSVLVRAEKVDYSTNLPVAYKTWDGVSGLNEPMDGAFIKKQHIIRKSSGEIEQVISNPLTTTYDDEISSIYIRAYDSLSRVVAEITGITKTQFDAALANTTYTANDLEQLADSASVEVAMNAIKAELEPHQLMTLYLYDDDDGGKHGPTRIIDPSGIQTRYKYDDFGRLSMVFDQNNDLVRKISYKFKNN